MITSIIEHLHGKIESYWENARVDYEIAKHLVNYANRGRLTRSKTEAATRARYLIGISPKTKTKDIAAVHAFTEFFINGAANYMYAHALSRFLPNIKRPGKIKAYEAVDIRPLTLAKLWLNLIRGNMEPVRRYANDVTKRQLALKDSRIEKEIIRVQKHNIKINHQNLSILASGKNSTREKIVKLRKLAAGSQRPKVFLRSAARAQAAAARWDRLLVHLMKSWR